MPGTNGADLGAKICKPRTVERRVGLLSLADGGTVFLDEVGDLSLPAQAMLLRFLQEGEVRLVGSIQTRRVNVRVIAATNRDLGRAAERGEFRADLIDRLSEVVLRVPPLRDRRGDIPQLVQHFMALHSRRHGAPVPRLSPAALQCLVQSDWPGNVRELSAVVSRAVLFTRHDQICAEDLDVVGQQDIGVAPSGATCRSPLLVSRRQRQALQLATTHRGVRRGDLMSRFGISREAARLDLAALVRAGWLRRTGRGRGSVYVATETASTARWT